MRLILGSGSPRRLELLAQIGIVPDEVRPPEIDETPLKGELPTTYCRRISLEKSEAIDIQSNEIVLCADTTVALGRRIMGKPFNKAQAAEFLLALSGRRHRVTTAISVRTTTRSWHRAVTTAVRMKSLSDLELNEYLGSDDWQDKAGGYAIQGPASTFIPWISGSFSAVVGLPLAETATLLRAAGFTWEISQ